MSRTNTNTVFDSLPVIIVTAKTNAAATEMISEIIDNDATAEAKPAGHESSDRVWRIVNKYYSALVRLHARAQADPPRAHLGPVGAHLVLLASDEVTPAAAERRLARAAWLPSAGAGADSEAAVNVLACEAAVVPDDLLALCARRRLEPVALRPEPEPEPEPCGPFPEERGVRAVRAALHAHAWPGLRRAPREEEEEEEEEELGEVQFSRALRALGAAATQTATLRGAERRAAAEEVVAAFAAAIGLPLSELDS